MKGEAPEREQMRDERFKAVESVLGTVAHDLNNLLTPLLAYPSLVRSELPEGSPALEILDVIEKAAGDLAVFSRRLLTFSNGDNEGLEPVDLNQIVADTVKRFRPSQCPEGISIVTSLGPDIGSIPGAVPPLTNVLHQLFVNAVESMPAGVGKLEISTDVVDVHSNEGIIGTFVPGRHIRVRVRDTGSGIPEAIRARLGEPFVTTKRSSTRRGAGLGLSMVYRVMKGHGGCIGVETECGKGTAVNLYFPLPAAPEERGGGELAGSPSKAGSLRMCDRDRILLVDDEPAIRRLFKIILSGGLAGKTVETAADGEEGIAAFRERHPAVIVMDLHMPVMDGPTAFAAIEKICRDENRELPKVIFCTGFAPPDGIRERVEQGAMHRLLTKPVAGEELVAAVKERLAS